MADHYQFTFANPEDPKAAPVVATVLTYSSAIQAPQLADATQDASKSAATLPKSSASTFNMTMELDESFLPLLAPLWSGKHIEKGTLTCYRAAGETPKSAASSGVPYLKVEMEAIVITHLSVASSGGGTAVVNGTMAPAKTTYTYQVADQPKG